MLRSEADELIKVINSFVVEVEAEPLTEVDEGGAVTLMVDESSEPVELTEEELRKAFRHQVPENFDPSKVEMVRSPMTGDRVFLKYVNERRWIPDLETLEAFGFTLEDVKEIKDDELRELKEGFGLLSKRLW
jgi:hypothetical protein